MMPDGNKDEATMYQSNSSFNIDGCLKRNWLKEAIQIHSGKSMMLPERKHLHAVIEYMKKLEKQIEQEKGSKEAIMPIKQEDKIL